VKIDRLKTDLAKAREKAAEWQARVRDLEKQITEQENLAGGTRRGGFARGTAGAAGYDTRGEDAPGWHCPNF
jgi:hypothetical protein